MFGWCKFPCMSISCLNSSKVSLPSSSSLIMLRILTAICWVPRDANLTVAKEPAPSCFYTCQPRSGGEITPLSSTLKRDTEIPNTWQAPYREWCAWDWCYPKVGRWIPPLLPLCVVGIRRWPPLCSWLDKGQEYGCCGIPQVKFGWCFRWSWEGGYPSPKARYLACSRISLFASSE